MENYLLAYGPTVLSFGAVGALLLLQHLVADAMVIMQKHQPGTPIPPDHSKMIFRAHRAHANTNETLGAFIILTLFALAAAAPPLWLNSLSVLYLVARIGHMCFYYFNLQMARSIAFAFAILALFGIMGVAFIAWFNLFPK